MRIRHVLFVSYQHVFLIRTRLTSLHTTIHQENLTVKDNKINTIQTAEELKSIFVPGNDFGFNATLELETAMEVEVTVEE